MKKIYSYKVDTHEFLNTTWARLDPKESQLQEKEIYLCPAGATFIKPPASRENEVAIFHVKTEKWIVKPDFRDLTYYDVDGMITTITEIGAVPPKVKSLIPPAEDIVQPRLVGGKWKETVLKYEDKIINTKADIDSVTEKMIKRAGEAKAKTEKLIAGDKSCKVWDMWLKDRKKILAKGEKFIKKHNLK
jgi:hypothetical protein